MIETFVERLASLRKAVAPAVIAPTITRDPADGQVLAVQADLIVSGDAHLLDLKGFKGIEIVTVAVERFETSRGP